MIYSLAAWFLLFSSAASSFVPIRPPNFPQSGLYSSAAGSSRKLMLSSADGKNFIVTFEAYRGIQAYSIQFSDSNSYNPPSRPDLLWFHPAILVELRRNFSNICPVIDILLEYSYIEKAFILRVDNELIRSDFVNVDPEGRLHRYLTRSHPTLSVEYINQALLAYSQFMLIKREFLDFEAQSLSPTPAIDHVWHTHILDLRRYLDFCLQFAGRVIEHDIERSLDQQGVKDTRIALTRATFTSLFGYKPDEHFWGADPAPTTGWGIGTEHWPRTCETRPANPVVEKRPAAGGIYSFYECSGQNGSLPTWLTACEPQPANAVVEKPTTGFC